MSQFRSRRDVLKLSLVVASAAAPGCYREGEELGALPEAESAAYFPQSVASGDPRPDSVVLWVRVHDDERADEALPLELVMSTDPSLSQPLAFATETVLTASPLSDHCLSVRVSGLVPGTRYYYRFRYRTELGFAETRIGRTLTAPEEDSAVEPRFAVVSCQDYGGKYFHVHRHIAEQELDFVLHLGDYIYETTGDPSFQTPTAERQVLFSAPEEALELGRAGATFLAAQSLGNYRDLYKIYRSDPDLQALHERHPIIAIWDDHEFSDDAHGDVATYTDGRTDETSPARRAAADRAFAEYMPVDYEVAPASRLDPSAKFPDNFRLYRRFVFGKHLELVVTDLRRFRPDHLVPEDAPPGAVYLTGPELSELLGEVPDDAVPYVDISTYADGAYLEALRDGAEQLDLDAERLEGNVSAVWINQALEALGAPSSPTPIDLADDALERGYAYHCLLKSSELSRLGSRYLVAVRPFQALARKLWLETDGASERLMGQRQRDWFLDTIASSTRTFKLWASSVAVQSRHIDLTGYEPAPSELRQRIAMSAEDWDGFPNERAELLQALAQAGNVLILSGDLHCFFAGTPFVDGDPEARVVELTTGSASSMTWLDGIQGSLSQDGSLPMDVQALAQGVGFLLADRGLRPNPHLAFQELGRNGYSVLEVGEAAVLMTLRTIATADVATPPQELRRELDELFDTQVLRAPAGSADLQRELSGEFRTWNMAEMSFL